MTDEPVRKTVKPSHEGACIPDPAHPGMDLPAGGMSVPMDHYWIGRLNRGEVVEVDDVSAEAPDSEDEIAREPTTSDPEPSPSAPTA